jgi:hypothetical protein
MAIFWIVSGRGYIDVHRAMPEFRIVRYIDVTSTVHVLR